MKLPNIKILISLIVFGFDFFFLIGLFFFDVPVENRDYLNMFLGASLTWSGGIIGYHFERFERQKEFYEKAVR